MMSPKLTYETFFDRVVGRDELPVLHRMQLKAGRVKKKIGYETWMELEGDLSVSVIYFNTRIVTQNLDGTVIVRNDGWYTSTTKERINHLLAKLSNSWRIASRNGLWVWYSRSDAAGLTPTGAIPFENGDLIVRGQLHIPYTDDRIWYFMDSRLKEIMSSSRTRKDVLDHLLVTTDEDVLKGAIRKHRRGYDLLPEFKAKRKAPAPKAIHTFEPKPRLVLA